MNTTNLKEFLQNEHNRKSLKGSTLPSAKLYPVYQQLIQETSFLPQKTQIMYRVWYVMNGVKTLPKCACGCGEDIFIPGKLYKRGHANKMADVKAKKVKSYIERFGVTNPSKCDIVKQKKIDTVQQHFGTTHYMRSEKALIKKEQKRDDIFQKIVTNNYYPTSGFIPCFTREEFTGTKKEYKFTCSKCNEVVFYQPAWSTQIRCLKCNPLLVNGGKPVIETELFNFLKSVYPGYIHLHTRKIIHPLELDAYIEEKKIAFEMNGIYWHSELNGKLKDFHINKTKKCNELGIRLVHIFEDEWNFKKSIVKNRIRYMLNGVRYRIHGRKCIIKHIDNIVKNRFLKKYHIQGNDKSNICLGAFYKNRLVSVMTFSSLRKALGSTAREGYFELCRFCTIAHFTIPGIANKMLKFFEEHYKPSFLITYADKRWSEGGMYLKLGFTHDHDSNPNYWYTNKNGIQRIHRFTYQKHLLKHKLSNFDDNLTEWENMKNNGFDRVWDCGNMVFHKSYKVNSK